MNTIRKALLMLCMMVSATMAWAEWDPTNAAQLQEALNQGGTVTIANDIALTSTLTISHDVTLDLNGHNITANGFRAIHVTAGEVEITSATHATISAGGEIADNSSVIRVGDGTGTYSGSMTAVRLTVDENVIVSTDKCYGITVFGSRTNETLIVNGTVSTMNVPAISGNGNAEYAGTIISIGEKAVIKATNEVAIYHPQTGTLTVSGSVTGAGGIEIKGGQLVVDEKATIIATASTPTHTANNNGTSTKGYAVAIVENGQYAGVSTVNISKDATIVGPIAVVKDSDKKPESPEVEFADGGVQMSVTVTDNTDKVVGQYLSLELAVNDAPAGSTITLLEDCAIASTIATSKDFTLDLAGKTITSDGQRALWIKSGNVKIQSTVADPESPNNGVIAVPTCSDASAILVGSDETAAVSLTVGAYVTISASQSAGIMLDGANTANSLTVNGGISTTDSSAIAGTKDMAGTTTITVAEGAQVSATNAVAIYQPQNGSLTVNGKVSGAGGIELKSGSLSVGASATITATATPTHEAQADAPSSLGYAIAIVENDAYAPASPAISIDNAASITGPIAELQDSEQSGFNPSYSGKAVNAKVAAIGNDEYFTLKDAVDIVPASGTVKLLRDLTLTSTLLMDQEKSYTLELAGNTLTGKAGEAAIQVTNGNVSIAGTTGSKVTTSGSAAAAIVLGSDEGENRNVLLAINNGVTVDGGSTVGILLKGEKTSETLEVLGTVTATGHSAIVGDGATNQIHVTASGNVTASDAVVIYHPQSGNLVIEGKVIGTATETSKAAGAIEMKGGNLTVNSVAAITAAGSTTHEASATAPSTNGYAIALVENPNFPGVSKANISNGATITGIIACVVDEENTSVPDPVFTGDVMMVAETSANSNKYAKLKDAIAEAAASTTVKLLDDLTLTETLYITKAITLNLGDYSLTGGQSSGATITINGNVTLTNGGITSAKDGISIAGGTVTLEKMTVNTQGVSLSVTDGTVTANNLSSFDSSEATTVALSGGIVTLAGKVYNTSTEASTANAIAGTEAAVLTIKDSSIVSSAKGNAVNWASTGDLTIKGGKIMGAEAVYAEAGSVTIEGGNFTGSENAVQIKNTESATCTPAIKGGIFICGSDNSYSPIVSVASGSATKAKGFVEGDYFSKKIAQSLCAPGYMSSPNPKNNGMFYLVDEIVINDGTNWTVPTDTFTIHTAKYVRNSGMGANGTKFGTLCLPFSFAPADVGTTMTFFTVNRIDGNILYLTEQSGTIAAGTPVIFQLTEPKTGFTIESSNAKILNENVDTVLPTDNTPKLLGRYTKDVIDSGLGNIYYLNSDAFHQAKQSVTVPAFRAYIYYEAPSSSGARPEVLNICIDDETEDLQSIMQDSSEELIFDLHGNRQDELKPGFNLVKMKDGRTIKVYVK